MRPLPATTSALSPMGAMAISMPVYMEGSPVNVFYAYSIDSGQTWTEEQITSQTGTNNQYCPSIAVDSQNRPQVRGMD